MSTQIYLVTATEIAKRRLILAGNQDQALLYAAQTRFNIEVASIDDLVSMLPGGITVELADGTATMETGFRIGG